MITSQQNIAVVKIFVIFQDYISVNTYHYIAGELSNNVNARIMMFLKARGFMVMF